MRMHDRVGHVYVMINPSMDGIVKIGRTTKSADARAKDLQTTGVPKQFVILWSEFVRNSDMVEKNLHSMFSASRVKSNREFFKVEPRDAIKALMEVARPFKFVLDPNNTQVSILSRLQEKFGISLRKELADVKLLQDQDGVYLEIRRRPYRDKNKEVVEYMNLDFVDNLCSERLSVSENADRFMTLDEYDMVNVTDLIEESVAKAIWKKHSRQE